MSSLREYKVYTARFPFLDSDNSKLRPVIVLNEPYGKHQVIAVLPISSKLSLEAVDFTINGLEDAGLVKPSAVQVHRLGTLLQADLVSRLGSLNKIDSEKLRESMREFLGL